MVSRNVSLVLAFVALLIGAPTVSVLRAEDTGDKATVVDEVAIGKDKAESDHGFKGEQTESGDLDDRKWRHAFSGGWFSYDMKVEPDAPQSVRCTYWGSDSGGREFDILIDGKKIASQTLDNNKPSEFVTVDYPIPAELLKGKSKVTVRFQAHPEKFAGGIFGCQIVKSGK